MANLQAVRGLRIVEAMRLTGRAALWEQGDMFWQSVLDILLLLRER